MTSFFCSPCNMLGINEPLIEDKKRGCYLCSSCGVVSKKYIPSNKCTFNESKQLDTERAPLTVQTMGSNEVLHKYHYKSILTPLERKKIRVFKLIEIICENLHLLNNIRIKCEFIFNQVSKLSCMKKRCKKESLLAAVTVYMACYNSIHPRSLKEVASASGGVSAPEIWKTFKLYSKDLRVPKKNISALTAVGRYSCLLGFKFKQEKFARDIYTYIQKHGCIPGHNPNSQLSVALTLASYLSVPGSKPADTKLIGKILSISENTVKKVVKLFIPHLQAFLSLHPNSTFKISQNRIQLILTTYT